MAMSMPALVMTITVTCTWMVTSDAMSLEVEENRLSNSSLPDFPNIVNILGLIEKIGNKNIPCIVIY